MRWLVLLLTLTLTACQIGKLKGPSAGGPSNRPPSTANPPDKGPVKVSHSVQLYWSRPLTRVNNDPMPEIEIGGYEIRYRKLPGSEFQSIILPADLVQYGLTTAEPADRYEFVVAVFDQDGIYSDFVMASP
ncbi:hypothetical protein [Reinekea sp.]|uniref:hypothetical protein n=1 Tax=Reinekea sp. TaxID=1970455 RepID=UPI002A83EF7A|nr:hypothetical protein [Reinekea sp.]